MTYNSNTGNTQKLIQSLKNIASGPNQPTYQGQVATVSGYKAARVPYMDLDSTYVTKHNMYELKEDLLVLSCVWYRLRTNPDLSIAFATHLLSKELFDNVEETDIKLASDVRDYYSKKIMMWKLKNIELSKFREDMNGFIHGDGKKVRDDILGLAYRLPEFYMHDKKVDSFFDGRNNVADKTIGLRVSSLQYVGCAETHTKRYNRADYWFSDEKNTLVLISLDSKNPLLSIWGQIIQKPIKLQGIYYNKYMEDKQYYRLDKFTLA